MAHPGRVAVPAGSNGGLFPPQRGIDHAASISSDKGLDTGQKDKLC